jgi:predicted nucleic acid-binding Zn ribbon protein
VGRRGGTGGSRAGGMNRARRPARSEGVHALGAVLGDLAGERPLAAGLALGRLASRWPAVVGERLAAETAPVRLERGVLVVAASTQAWAAQVRFLEREIAARAGTADAPVEEVRVLVDPSHLAVRRGTTP